MCSCFHFCYKAVSIKREINFPSCFSFNEIFMKMINAAAITIKSEIKHVFILNIGFFLEKK